MRLFTGTSGFSYKEWCGAFYPEGMKPDAMLDFYGERLGAVEINSSFYRMPRAEILYGWAEKVPEEFVFVLKASRRITHMARLSGADDAVSHLWKQSMALGNRRGPFLFQLPPNLRADMGRLEAFLAALPSGLRGAFEFRHDSWTDGGARELLLAANQALCIADSSKEQPADVVSSADWGYLRLRREDYTDEELTAWADTILEQPWQDVFVFFKHEEKALAPAMAMRFSNIFEGRKEHGGC